jgi:hypothetical protein
MQIDIFDNQRVKIDVVVIYDRNYCNQVKQILRCCAFMRHESRTLNSNFSFVMAINFHH